MEFGARVIVGRTVPLEPIPDSGCLPPGSLTHSPILSLCKIQIPSSITRHPILYSAPSGSRPKTPQDNPRQGKASKQARRQAKPKRRCPGPHFQSRQSTYPILSWLLVPAKVKPPSILKSSHFLTTTNSNRPPNRPASILHHTTPHHVPSLSPPSLPSCRPL